MIYYIDSCGSVCVRWCMSGQVKINFEGNSRLYYFDNLKCHLYLQNQTFFNYNQKWLGKCHFFPSAFAGADSDRRTVQETSTERQTHVVSKGDRLILNYPESHLGTHSQPASETNKYKHDLALSPRKITLVSWHTVKQLDAKHRHPHTQCTCSTVTRTCK